MGVPDTKTATSSDGSGTPDTCETFLSAKPGAQPGLKKTLPKNHVLFIKFSELKYSGELPDLELDGPSILWAMEHRTTGGV